MSRSIYCALCDDGPFKRSVVPPTHPRVLEGYYFCGWCWEYISWNPRLYASKGEAFVARAKRVKGVRSYPHQTTK